jgi:hypothetical protein
MMQVLGRDDEAERQHERAELGNAAETPGPVRSLTEAKDLSSLQKYFQSAVSELEERVARTDKTDPKLPYYQTLIVLTKKVELDLDSQIASLTRLFRDLDEMHDFVHEIYPG